MDLKLTDRHVLVAGSSSGIGFGIARAFVGEGARVVITGRDPSRLSRAAQELDNLAGHRIFTFCGDFTNPQVVATILDGINVMWGGLDVLVLNVGGGRSRTLFETDSAEWNRVLQLNLVSPADALRQSVPLLRKGRTPAVIFVGSIAGLEAIGAPVAYSAAKAGLTHTTKTWAQLLGPEGIRVNMVAPGNIFFEGGTWEERLAAEPKTVAAMLQTSVPLRRLGTVDEVASTVLFVASEQASFITGSCIVVDGGQTRAI